MASQLSGVRPTALDRRSAISGVTRLVPFVLVVFGCLMIITYVPVISIGLRDLVYAR